MTAITQLRSSRTLLANLALREIRGKYKRTALGQLWSLLNPIAVMTTYAVVFSIIVKSHPEPGNPSGLDIFALWLSCALLPWMFFNNVVTSGMSVILGNANLIKKVYFPRYTLVVADALAWLFTFTIEMLVLLVALEIFGAHSLTYVPGAIVVMALLFCFGLGLSFMLSVANVYFRDTQHFVSILFQLWFYATPIVYPGSLITEKHPGLETAYNMNPLTRFVGLFRELLYDGRWPSLADFAIVAAMSLGALAVGYLIFQHFEGGLAEEL